LLSRARLIEREDGITDAKTIAVLKNVVADSPLFHPRAVDAVVVQEDVAGGRLNQPGMVPGNALVLKDDDIVRFPPDGDFIGVQLQLVLFTARTVDQSVPQQAHRHGLSPEERTSSGAKGPGQRAAPVPGNPADRSLPAIASYARTDHDSSLTPLLRVAILIKRKSSEIMSIFFSRQCEYGVQAVLYLALQQPGRMTSIRQLTGRLGIPYHFLAKILQDLTRKGLLISLKGPAGGFALANPPEQITLLDVIEAIDGSGFLRQCILGFSDCSDATPCSVHRKWAALRAQLRSMLTSRNIARMAAETIKAPYSQAG
jgi:Rrf2 family iron-sulfur cluster assembly transcriptional regulator